MKSQNELVDKNITGILKSKISKEQAKKKIQSTKQQIPFIFHFNILITHQAFTIVNLFCYKISEL